MNTPHKATLPCGCGPTTHCPMVERIDRSTLSQADFWYSVRMHLTAQFRRWLFTTKGKIWRRNYLTAKNRFVKPKDPKAASV